MRSVLLEEGQVRRRRCIPSLDPVSRRHSCWRTGTPPADFWETDELFEGAPEVWAHGKQDDELTEAGADAEPAENKQKVPLHFNVEEVLDYTDEEKTNKQTGKVLFILVILGEKKGGKGIIFDAISLREFCGMT